MAQHGGTTPPTGTARTTNITTGTGTGTGTGTTSGAAHGSAATIEPLLREVLGRRLRILRLERDERLVETAARAGISPQYLSEIERGLKEPSSEMIAAIGGALGTSLLDLTTSVAQDLGAPAPTATVSYGLYAVAA